MTFKKPINTGLPLLFGLMLITSICSAQDRYGYDYYGYPDYSQRYQNGTLFYNAERWQDAAIEFRQAQETAASDEDWAKALYWVILSELGYSDYGSAILDMDALARRAPNSTYARDMVYHKARVYFNQGYFDDSLSLFRRYIDSVSFLTDEVTTDRVAAAYFWMGECLYTMRQYDEAERFYVWIIDNYPVSPKYEACQFRLEMIKQKKIESELLSLLQWSHEESLRTSENFQRTIRTYEQILNEYQRRIAELTGGDYIPSTQYNQTYSNEALLERARALSEELERIMNEYNGGGR